MTRYLLSLFFMSMVLLGMAQTEMNKYGPSKGNPFGSPHPEAPEAVKDWEPMMGISDCISLSRNPDGTWQDSLKMVWQFKYIMNGTSVQDETWIADGRTATSIRQYNADSANWVVTYAGSGFVSNTPGAWLGGMEEGDIVLKQPQKAPNGMDGTSRLTFFNISDNGFDWKGEWVDKTEKIIYPFWTISCRKRK